MKRLDDRPNWYVARAGCDAEDFRHFENSLDARLFIHPIAHGIIMSRGHLWNITHRIKWVIRAAMRETKG